MWYLICSIHGPTLLTLPLRVETLWWTQLAKSLVSLHSRVMWSPLYKTFEASLTNPLGLHRMKRYVFQFSMLHIYHRYGCHFKGRSIMQWSACFILQKIGACFILFATDFIKYFQRYYYGNKSFLWLKEIKVRYTAKCIQKVPITFHGQTHITFLQDVTSLHSYRQFQP